MSETEIAAAENAPTDEFEFEPAAEALPTAVGWPRILARGADMLFVYLVFSIGVFALFGMVMGMLGQLDLLHRILQAHWLPKMIAPLLAWGVAESVFLPMTGATPGKLLLGLRVVRDDADSYPGFGRSFIRTFWMLIRGLLLGLPVISYFAMFYWSSRIMPPFKALPWDVRGRTRVVTEREPGKFAMAVAILLIILGVSWSVFTMFGRGFG